MTQNGPQKGIELHSQEVSELAADAARENALRHGQEAKEEVEKTDNELHDLLASLATNVTSGKEQDALPQKENPYIEKESIETNSPV